MGTAVHLLGLFFGVVGTGAVYLLTSSEFSTSNARNALNWQLFFLVATVVLLVSFFAVGSDLVGVLLGLLLLALLFADLAFCLWATVKAAGGEAWRYPLAPEFV